MGNNDIAKLQKTLLDALKEFKKICDKEGIVFFLRGGSVMGSVKYKGFVPWDDDVDIAIPRDQYERMIDILNDKVIAGKYKVVSYKYYPEIHCYFPRLFLVEEERIKLGLPSNTHMGLHLMDILPLDGAPNNTLLRNIYFAKVYALRYLSSLGTPYVEGHVNMHSKKQKFIINFGKFFQLHKIFPQIKVYNTLDKLYKRYDWRVQDYAGTITASLFKKEVMKKEIWGKGKFLPFETEQFMVPELYDSYLKQMYGENYLTEEPQNKKSHHE
ncbi:LicD family protein [Streptococcus pacificus]|uniref:LicD family protein n=1 Tax=Streptococcus pacificus TaxID=2740577 RepID=A0ABS0ZHD3_9STRE|nr:LicD family protein [Streptococcus pacificus]MBJ8325401.1 LicD family protein [Streptococcus pacificus]